MRPRAQAAGFFAFAGQSTATVPVVSDPPEASALGALVLAGQADALIRPRAAALGALRLAGEAIARTGRSANAEGALALAGQSAARFFSRANASGALSLAGEAVARQQPSARAAGALAFAGQATAQISLVAQAGGALRLAGQSAATALPPVSLYSAAAQYAPFYAGETPAATVVLDPGGRTLALAELLVAGTDAVAATASGAGGAEDPPPGGRSFQLVWDEAPPQGTWAYDLRITDDQGGVTLTQSALTIQVVTRPAPALQSATAPSPVADGAAPTATTLHEVFRRTITQVRVLEDVSGTPTQRGITLGQGTVSGGFYEHAISLAAVAAGSHTYDVELTTTSPEEGTQVWGFPGAFTVFASSAGTTLYYVMLHGQSLAVGDRGVWQRSTVSHDPRAIAPNTPVYYHGGAENRMLTTTAFVPIAERSGIPDKGSGVDHLEDGRHTPCSALAHQLAAELAASGDTTSLAGCGVAGVGAQPIENLTEGGTTGVYEAMVAAASHIKGLADAAGYNLYLIAAWQHGEAGTNDPSGYYAMLGTHITSLQADLAAVTGQSEVPFFMVPTKRVGVGRDQFQMARDRADVYLAASPASIEFNNDDPWTASSDAIHFSEAGNDHVGGYYGRAIGQLITVGTWSSLYMTAAGWDAAEPNQILVTTSVAGTPAGAAHPLVVEGLGGLRLFDDLGAEYGITSVVAGTQGGAQGGTLVLTLASAIDLTGPRTFELRSRDADGYPVPESTIDGKIYLDEELAMGAPWVYPLPPDESTSRAMTLDRYLVLQSIAVTVSGDPAPAAPTLSAAYYDEGSAPDDAPAAPTLAAEYYEPPDDAPAAPTITAEYVA